MHFTNTALLAGLALTASVSAAPSEKREDIGQAILDKAREAAGIPYAWGGGSCDGPTGDIAPYDYGETGFDCSGLVNWALCQVTDVDVFDTSMRVTQGMYCDMEDELGFPYANSLLPVDQPICLWKRS